MSATRWVWLAGAVAIAIAVVAVSLALKDDDPAPAAATLITGPTVSAPPPSPVTTTIPAFALGVYDPVAAGEELPDGYRPLLDRDQIRPVYEPVFISAELADWPADSLVIGVADGEVAKAYPVTHLNSRELVIDTLGDVPILVSW